MLNVGTKYVFSSHKNPANDPFTTQRMICGKTGVNKTFERLTDIDIEKMIKAGSKDFKLRPVADLSPKKAK
jgi:hypothetical protein